ncbi:hypothetical protein ACQ4PT_062030 [Festuca glaucescens]
MDSAEEREKEILQELCKNSTVSWINAFLKPRKVVDHVEGYVIVAAVFMITLAIGTPWRRQSRSIRYVVEAVFVLSFPLLSYTLGLMQGQIIKNELYPVWAMFLAMLFGGTGAMSVQKLDEYKQSMKIYYDSLLFIFYVGTVLGIFSIMGKELPHIDYVVMIVIFVLSFKIVERQLAIILASKPSSENGIKRLADYMKHEHQLSTSYNPRTMQGYKYMVLIHEGETIFGEGAVTLEKIWNEDIGVLSSSDNPSICCLKDTCLSFALFHLVVRRYFGYTCAESKLDKTRVLVLNGLLQTEQDYERAFQVIEAELAFLYDFFFTKYAFIMYGKEAHLLGTHVSIYDDLLVETSTRDVLVTKVALGVLSIFPFLEIWFYCVSDWAKVSLVCKYVTNPSWQGNAYVEKLLLRLGRPHRSLRYWCNNIGQYSVLDSFSSSYLDRLVQRSQSRKAGKPVELSIEVKKAVAWSVKNSITGRLSSGASTLMRHGMSDELWWACQVDDSFTLTHSILVWHVATCYCEISEAIKSSNGNVVHPNQVVAANLSRYCAYLVAFAPTLLAGSPIESESTLDELVGEAKEAFQNLVVPREKYEKLRDLHSAQESRVAAQLLTKGAILGKALESMENGTRRWDLLADFWAEMIVYVAPSDNVAGHIELLAQGGEFVTHVWALLMHAGILERPAADAAAVP